MRKSLWVFVAVVAFIAIYFVITSKIIPNKNK